MSTIHPGDTPRYNNHLPVPKLPPIQLVSGSQALATSATLSVNEAVAKRRAFQSYERLLRITWHVKEG